MEKWLFRRRAVQLGAVALLFLPVVMEEPFWFGTYLSSQFFSLSLTDPLAALEVFLAGKSVYMPLFWSAVPLILLGVIGGRLFCGWVCPVNTLLEMLALIKSPGKKGKSNAAAPYLVLPAVLLGSAILSLPVFTIISPVGTLSRAAAFGLGIEFLLVAAIIIGEWIWGRKAWCRMVCPAGALYGLFGRLRPLRVKLDAEACDNCGRCRSVCSMQVEPGSTRPLHLMNCVSCADCVDCCAQGALRLDFVINRKGENANHESVKSFTR